MRYNNHAHSTIRNYTERLAKWVTPIWRNLEIQTITRNQVSELIFHDPEMQKMSEHSRKTILKMIRRVFEMAVEDGVLDRNPCTGIQVKVAEVEQKVLTKTEVEIFLREAMIANHRFFPIWFTALETGLRSGELMSLQWTDIDLEGGIMSITRQWSSNLGFTTTKTQRSRVVPISSELSVFFNELKTKRKSETDFVLPHLLEWENGEQARITREFCVAIGITPIKFHDLRATFITNLLVNGVSLAQVMSVVGHHQIKTTNGYLRKAGVEVRGVTDRLGYKMPKAEVGNVFQFRKRES